MKLSAEGTVLTLERTFAADRQKEWFGQVSWGKMVFSNIQPIESFEYTDYFVDEDANVQEGMPVSETTLQFLEENVSTKLVSVTHFESEEALKTVMVMGMLEGVTQTWDRLDDLVAT